MSPYDLFCERTWSPRGNSMEFHLHDRMELYFFISGNVDYFVERGKYHLSFGDVLLLNSTELHKPTFRDASPYERMVLHFDPALAARFSTPDFDLLACFTHRPRGEGNYLRMHTAGIRALYDLLNRLSDLCAHPTPGDSIIQLAVFLEILVLVGRAWQTRGSLPPAPRHALQGVLDYIDQNPTEDLSLDALSARFYLSKPYLCRAFKAYTGATIHSYILSKRIARAKQLLGEGQSVTAACQESGFHDYANFIRVFRKLTGQSPGAFKKGNANPLQ